MKQLLAYTPAALDAIDAAEVAAALAAELSSDADAADAQVRDALDAIDALAIRAMKLRMDHALADDTSLAPPTRNVFAQTIASYAGRLELLRERARDVAARASAQPDAVAALVVAAAEATLAQRDALARAVLADVQARASVALPAATDRARDGRLADAERTRWSAVRRDLEALAADPRHVRSAPRAQRLAALPALLDEPAPVREASLAELIELD